MKPVLTAPNPYTNTHTHARARTAIRCTRTRQKSRGKKSPAFLPPPSTRQARCNEWTRGRELRERPLSICSLPSDLRPRNTICVVLLPLRIDYGTPRKLSTVNVLWYRIQVLTPIYTTVIQSPSIQHGRILWCVGVVLWCVGVVLSSAGVYYS